MRRILPALVEALRDGAVALARIIAVEGSAPREPGAALFVRADGTIVGSLTGGCVEPAIHDVAAAVIAHGGIRRCAFGPISHDGFEIGLACGGRVEVLVHAVRDPAPWSLLAHEIAEGRGGAAATVLEGAGAGETRAFATGREEGVLVPDESAGLRSLAAAALSAEHDHVTGFRPPRGFPLVLHVFAPAPRMFVFGASAFAAALAALARSVGYRVTVCDRRPAFATRERLPDAHEIVVDEPHAVLARTQLDRRSVVVAMTHELRTDVPALALALRSEAGFVGAMGSRAMHREREEALVRLGLTRSQLECLSSPVGLDIGARTPEEVAVSIMGDVIADRTAALAGRLTTRGGPVHPRP